MDVVVSDLVSCLEDYTLPLMQFSEAFAVVQVGNWTCSKKKSLISGHSMSGLCTAKHHCNLSTVLHVHVKVFISRVTFCLLTLIMLYSMACNEMISS